ncbi:hypothetical protein MTO96_050851 [Rhipicephalus appendiculatus]
MYFAFQMRKPWSRRRPGVSPKPRRFRPRFKPSRAGGTGATRIGRRPHGNRVSSKPKLGAGVHHENHPSSVPKHVQHVPGHNKHDTHHSSSSRHRGKVTGTSASSPVAGTSPPMAESAPGAVSMASPGMHPGGFPDYGSGSMGAMIALQTIPGAMASLGNAGNDITRTVFEHRGSGSDDEGSDKENEKTDKEKDGRDKDTKEKGNKDKDNKVKKLGQESGPARGRSG